MNGILKSCKLVHLDRQLKVNSIFLLSLFLLFGLTSACLQEQHAIDYHPVKIASGPGPEDIVVYRGTDGPILIMSTCGRRDGVSHGEIEGHDPVSGKHLVFTRTNEPADLILKPHGIYCLEKESAAWMYVISHDDVNQKHPVLKYRIENDTLCFEKLIIDDLLVSPNALVVLPDESVLVCNDAARRGSKWEQILGLKRGNILHISIDGKAEIVAEGLGMPAGMNYSGNQVYVSAATENVVYAFDLSDGKLSNKRVLCKIKGPDNLRWYQQKLIVACHEKKMKFVKHISNPTNISPTAIYLLDTETGDKNLIFHDSGENISAGSVGVIWSGKLFVGQIFESGIISVGFQP